MAVKRMLERVATVEVAQEDVMSKCPLAHSASAVDQRTNAFIHGILNEMTKAKKLVLARGTAGMLAYRQFMNPGVASRLDGNVGASAEEGEEDKDPGAPAKKPIDDGANVWGIGLLPEQQDGSNKKGEIPRAVPKPATSEHAIKALYSIIGSLQSMAPGYTLMRMTASGGDANQHAVMVSLALRCG